MCSGYVIVAWIWAAIWYVLLDPIKWALCWVLNEDGFRDTVSGNDRFLWTGYFAVGMTGCEAGAFSNRIKQLPVPSSMQDGHKAKLF